MDAIESYATFESEDEPEWYEKLISWFIRLIGEGLRAIISLIVQEPLSIDSLVFDRFSATNLAFFDNDVEYYRTNENPTGKNTLVGGALGNLDSVFILFRNIALIIYMIILVYMGLRILIMTANASKKAKYKELVLDWIKGIVILFFFPYVIRYTMLLNHAFVTYLYNNIGNGSSGTSAIAGATIPHNDGSLETIDTISSDDITNTETVDYMTQMYRTAKRSRRISDAICWTIMVIQIIQFLIVYMRRLITVIFLIAIFPLVTISYAIDKIGDGKSQAFNNWYKEFVLQVFIQSFHAMNYVLVMSIILGADANWLLKIIGVGYIAKGGDILRSLFAQMKGGAGSEGGPLEVAKAYMKTRLAIEGIHSIRKSAAGLVGANSMLGKGINRIQNARDGMAYEKALEAESDANRAYKVHYAQKDAEKAKKDATKVKEMAQLEEERRTLEGDTTPEGQAQLAEKEREIREKEEEYKKSMDQLARLSEEELQTAVQAVGLTPAQITQLEGVLNHAGAIGILRNSRHERNIDIRTAVDVVFRDRAIYTASTTTGNAMLDRYINATKGESGLTDNALKKINAAHSITIDDAAFSARAPITEPEDADDKLDYALNMVKNAYTGEYTIEELTRSTKIIDQAKTDMRNASKIKTMEEEAGFTLRDFEQNLAIQTINDSNRMDNIGNEEAQERIDTAIDVVKSMDARADREILSGLHANRDELQKGVLPLLKTKEDERSKLQKELAKTIEEEGTLGRYTAEQEQYLEDRIEEVKDESRKQMIRGVAGTVFGAAGSAAKVSASTAMSGASIGMTYTGWQDNQSAATVVASSVKTVDSISGKIGQLGNSVAETFVQDGTPLKITQKSVNISKSGRFKDGVVSGAVDEEMKRRENIRNKMLNRRRP